jgi:hypothetical protein
MMALPKVRERIPVGAMGLRGFFVRGADTRVLYLNIALEILTPDGRVCSLASLLTYTGSCHSFPLFIPYFQSLQNALPSLHSRWH